MAKNKRDNVAVLTPAAAENKSQQTYPLVAEAGGLPLPFEGFRTQPRNQAEGGAIERHKKNRHFYKKKTHRALTLRCAAAVAAFFWPRVAVGRVLEIITVFQS